MYTEGGDVLFVPEGPRSRRIRDVRAADLQEEMAEQRFSVPPGPKTAATQRTSQRAAASNQIERDPPRAERAIRSRIARRCPGRSEGADTFFRLRSERGRQRLPSAIVRQR
jgi:hypothetical protein